MSTEQTRIFLWAVPRSTSTAFLRAMMNRKNIKVSMSTKQAMLEPYGRAYYFGPSRVSWRYESQPINDEDTYENIRAMCEEPFPGADEVFVKDMAYYLVNQLENADILPAGYIHTFLIRNPAKSIPSFYKVSTNKEVTGCDRFDPRDVGFKELYQMFELVTKKLGQEAIIVDSDDLTAHPEDMLRQYCTRVGIEFQQSMVDWEDDPQSDVVCKDWPAGWFTSLFHSKRFEANATKPASSLGIPSLPQDAQDAIHDSMPYYEKMYGLRIKPMLGAI